MSIQYTVPGFGLTTFGTWVSSRNHQTRAPALNLTFYLMRNRRLPWRASFDWRAPWMMKQIVLQLGPPHPAVRQSPSSPRRDRRGRRDRRHLTQLFDSGIIKRKPLPVWPDVGIKSSPIFGSGCGSVGRVVTSNYQRSAVRIQSLAIIYVLNIGLFTVICVEKTKIKKKTPDMAQFF